MIRSLWTSASGMRAQQFNVDVISNNLANVNTTGFKKSRADFQDLLYSTLKAGAGQEPIQVGHGVRTVATSRDMTQGSLTSTGGDLDLAIEGRGYFVVELPDGTQGYTRAGNFKLDADGSLVTASGYRLVVEGDDEIPGDTAEISISRSGVISVRVEGDDSFDELGTITLASFANEGGLEAVGDGVFRATEAAGDVTDSNPGEDGLGTVLQGYLETSNVSIVDEMVSLIVAQRAYEINSKAIQTSDEMLGLANNLRR